MTEYLPEEIAPYADISAKAFQHPADRAATAALHSVPMLDTLVRRLIEWRYERALRQVFLGDSLRVGERQLPGLWAAHTSAMKTLDMPDTYDLYVGTGVWSGAQTIGAGRPLIVIDSQLLRILDHDERRALIAHELGHILSDHVLYATALGILIGLGGNLPFVLGLPFRAVRAVLLEWYRAAELSCDRAATLAVRDPQIVCRLLMVTAAGLPSSELDLDAFMAQAMEYRSWERPHGPRAAVLQRARPDPCQRGEPGLGGPAVGPGRRVRPHRPGRVPATRRAD